jgi:hypothetical protein
MLQQLLELASMFFGPNLDNEFERLFGCFPYLLAKVPVVAHPHSLAAFRLHDCITKSKRKRV